MTTVASRGPNHSSLSLNLPPHVLILVFMVTGFTTIIYGARLLSGFRAVAVDPFVAYAAVFPGQTRSAVTAFGFSCPSNFLNPGGPQSLESCDLWPSAGKFDQVSVVVAQDIIRQITFNVRGNWLSLGDLYLLWGRPQRVTKPDVPEYYEWPDGWRLAWADDAHGRGALLQSVRRVSIFKADWDSRVGCVSHSRTPVRRIVGARSVMWVCAFKNQARRTDIRIRIIN